MAEGRSGIRKLTQFDVSQFEVQIGGEVRDFHPEEAIPTKDLRRMDLPLEDAARIASWCHSGHCANTNEALPSIIATRRAEIAGRIAGLQVLDARLADLERHLGRPKRALNVLGNEPGAAIPCCDAAGAVRGSAATGSCSCCTPGAAAN